MRFEASVTLEGQIKFLATELERTRSDLRILQRQHRRSALSTKLFYLSRWSTTGNTSHRGRNPNVFALASYPTKGCAVQIPPLLFQKAAMRGPIAGLSKYQVAGTEGVNGRPCYKLVGELALAYKTGAVTDAHPTMVWIDVETLLVRKVFEDASTAGGLSTTTTTFEPQANPDLDDSRFRFKPSPAS